MHIAGSAIQAERAREEHHQLGVGKASTDFVSSAMPQSSSGWGDRSISAMCIPARMRRILSLSLSEEVTACTQQEPHHSGRNWLRTPVT